MVSHEQRQRTIERIVCLARIDPRLCGGMILGTDARESIDLCAIVYDDHEPANVFADWRRRLCAILPTVSSETLPETSMAFGESLLLKDGVELTIRFLHSKDLRPTGAHWKVLFDRVGDLDWRMKVQWVKKTATRKVTSELENSLASIRHHILLAQTALESGRHWQALSDIEELRKRLVHLFELRTGEDCLATRSLDRLPDSVLHAFERTLCASPKRTDITRTLQALIEAIMAEIRTSNKEYGLALDSQVESMLQQPCCV